MKTRHDVLVKVKGVFFLHSQEGLQYHAVYWGRECRKWAREDVCRSGCDHELCFILARGKGKRAVVCGVMSCITASVHNPSHQTSFWERILFNTVRSISRWRRDVGLFVSTHTMCKKVWWDLREFISAEALYCSQCTTALLLSHTKDQAESDFFFPLLKKKKIKHQGRDSLVGKLRAVSLLQIPQGAYEYRNLHFSSSGASPLARISDCRWNILQQLEPNFSTCDWAELHPFITRASFSAGVLEGSFSLHNNVILYTDVCPWNAPPPAVLPFVRKHNSFASARLASSLRWDSRQTDCNMLESSVTDSRFVITDYFLLFLTC